MDDLKSISNPPPIVDDYFVKFYEEVMNRNLERNIIPIRGDSRYTLNIHKDLSISLAFVDGDHSYEGCISDLRNLYPKMATGSLIYVHDYWLVETGNFVALCVRDFIDEVGIAASDLSRIGSTAFARIQVIR